MEKKTWDISTHDFIAVSFYTTLDCSGGALREQFFFMCKKGRWMDKRHRNAAEARAKKLGASGYRMWICVPRAFGVKCECFGDEECRMCS